MTFISTASSPKDTSPILWPSLQQIPQTPSSEPKAGETHFSEVQELGGSLLTSQVCTNCSMHHPEQWPGIRSTSTYPWTACKIGRWGGKGYNRQARYTQERQECRPRCPDLSLGKCMTLSHVTTPFWASSSPWILSLSIPTHLLLSIFTATFWDQLTFLSTDLPHLLLPPLT